MKLGAGSTSLLPGGTAEASTDFSFRAPLVVTTSRAIDETFPLRNYVFFDSGSTMIPQRYRMLSPTEAGAFREEQLLKPAPVETGRSDKEQMRSNRQMEVYYNALNVFGDRMRRNPDVKITVTGAGDGNAALGAAMADTVKNYLVSTFGIDPSRIATEGRAFPPHKSGSGSAAGEDRKMIDAENSRVEISGPDEILRPVRIESTQEEPIDNDIVFEIPSGEDVAFWSVEIDGPNGYAKTFGPYRNTTTARIDSKPILGSLREGNYTARVVKTMTDGGMTTSSKRAFRLVRADKDEEQTGVRYSTLFEFDQSKTVQTYEQFLSGTVAPAIPDGATVIIHGHTDVIGDPEYNVKLSRERSDATQSILARELTKAGKTVTFDTYGFGEDERRAPFNNTLPEQRYYNRTVVIEVVPHR